MLDRPTHQKKGLRIWEELGSDLLPVLGAHPPTPPPPASLQLWDQLLDVCHGRECRITPYHTTQLYSPAQYRLGPAH